MRTHPFMTILGFAVILWIASFCIVQADQPVPALPETQGLVTSTGADVVGIATEMDSGAWTLTNNPSVIYTYTWYPGMAPFGYPMSIVDASLMQAQLEGSGGSLVGFISGPNFMVTQFNIPQSLLNQLALGEGVTYQAFINSLVAGGWVLGPTIGSDLHVGELSVNQVQYTTAYDANILAQAGHTVLFKNMNINTGNKVAATQSNLKAQTLLTYIATSDAGNVVGSENLLIDGAGSWTPASDRMLCPFVGGTDMIIPAYCNIVQMGSAYDLTAGSVTTEADNRFVGIDATVPVAQNYAIDVKPYDTTSGQIPAMGSASAYIRVHVQEARDQTMYRITEIGNEGLTYTANTTPLKAEDLQYSEVSSASGVISRFSKSMSYTSQASSTPMKIVPVNIYVNGG